MVKESCEVLATIIKNHHPNLVILDPDPDQ